MGGSKVLPAFRLATSSKTPFNIINFTDIVEDENAIDDEKAKDTISYYVAAFCTQLSLVMERTLSIMLLSSTCHVPLPPVPSQQTTE